MLQAQADAYGDGLDLDDAPSVHVVAQAALLRVALLQLAVHLRTAVRPRAVRQVPGGSRALPRRATPTLLSRAGIDTAEELGATFGIDVTSRSSGPPASTCAATASPSTNGWRRPSEASRVRDHSSTTSTATQLARGARRHPALPGRSGLERSVRATRRARRAGPICRKPLRAELGGQAAAGARSGHRVGQRQGRHRQVPVGARRWQPDRDRADAVPRSGDRLHLEPGRLRDGVRVLRHRAGRLHPPPDGRRDRRAGGARHRTGTCASTAACRNVVFMGMGEPMANEAAVWAAVERIHGDLGLSARHITISTVGIMPGIRKLATRPLPVNLAVSLHAANDALRDELVPINRRYPIDDLIDACRDYLVAAQPPDQLRVGDDRRRQRSRSRTPRELAALCRRLRPSAHVNLIPLNPTPGYPTTRDRRRGACTSSATGWSARRQRHGAPEPRHRHRRRLRPTRRRPTRNDKIPGLSSRQAPRDRG